MRTLWYLFLFLAPTALVVGYINREPLREFLEEQGYLEQKEESVQKVAAPEEEPAPEAVVEAIAPKPVKEVVPEPEVAIQNKKPPLPEFTPLVELVNNWQKVPKNAFPETVITRKPVSLEIKRNGKVVGQAPCPAGQKVYPISLDGDQLTVSKTPGGDGAMGTMNIDDTNFKQLVEKTYNDWKKRQTDDFLLREAGKQVASEPVAREVAPTQPPAADKAALGPEPKVLPGGRIQEMVDSITAGDVKEIKLDKIEYWRWNGYEEIASVGYWTGVVGYVADTIFGELNTEGKALIRNGKVVKWIYSGSEEPIK